uniref:Homoserine dehydrogenase n=1 Tax=Leptocylindrus danicus TaxID=163516 RepID=A0A7S2KEY7_9STRA
MATTTISKTLRIGMIGGGTVGGGVYELIMNRLGGATATITKICVRDLDKPRDFTVDTNVTSMVSDVHEILNDENIDCVVEVMGGTGLAKTVVLEALKKGKSVVTANKALIAEHLEEINKLSGSGANFCYEAAVCGGIPIINTLQTCYTGDIINEVMGICNGTTNYMLGKMEEGAEYDEVLKEAQDLGYAEADPTADVEGHDVRAKIAILAKLAFGQTVPVDTIPCSGITQISSVDFEYAKLLGCTIKLVGTAARLSEYGEHDGALSVYVTPKIVPMTHLLASARGSGNAVAVNSSNLGTASYTGPGAGRYPTASSVVADICRVADGSCSAPFPSVTSTSSIEIDNDYTSAFYIRISFQDGLGIIRSVGELAEAHGVSINSVLQNPIRNRMEADFVVTTESCKLSQVVSLCDDIAKQEYCRMPPLSMPILLDKDSEYSS